MIASRVKITKNIMLNTSRTLTKSSDYMYQFKARTRVFPMIHNMINESKCLYSVSYIHKPRIKL